MMLLSLAVGLVVAIVGLGGDSLSPSPQPREPIRLLSASHEIDFPNEVVLRLEAEAEADISEITLFYRLGRGDVRIYGYPEFTSARRVTADFRIKTGGANYIPSGTDIEYYYVVKDAVGNSYESDKFSLEYKDPSFDWQRFQQGNLIFLWHDRPADLVMAVANEVDQRLEPVRQLLSFEATRPMKAVILNSAGEAGRSFPLISEAARRNHLYGGFAFGELDVFVLMGLNTDGIVHETTHLLLDEALDSPLAIVPGWLNEGLAMYFEASSRGREAIVSQAARGDRLLPLSSMGNVPGRPQDVRLFYAQSWSLVTYMMDTYGEEPMAALLSAINEGRRVEEAVPAAYGKTMEELDRQWREQVVKEASASPMADAGTIGTSILIGGAVAVAVMAIVVRWLRRLTSPPDAGSTAP